MKINLMKKSKIIMLLLVIIFCFALLQQPINFANAENDAESEENYIYYATFKLKDMIEVQSMNLNDQNVWKIANKYVTSDIYLYLDNMPFLKIKNAYYYNRFYWFQARSKFLRDETVQITKKQYETLNNLTSKKFKIYICIKDKLYLCTDTGGYGNDEHTLITLNYTLKKSKIDILPELPGDKDPENDNDSDFILKEYVAQLLTFNCNYILDYILAIFLYIVIFLIVFFIYMVLIKILKLIFKRN